MNARTVWTIARKDLLRRRRDPVGVLVTLSIPVTLLVVFQLAFGGIDAGKMPRAKLLVADQDQSLLSRFVAGAFGQGQLGEMVEAVPVDSARALREIRRGKASAALFIPRGFGRDYLEGRTTNLRLLKNPSQRILPSIIEEIVSTLADGGASLRDLLGGPLARITNGTGGWSAAPSDEIITGVSVDIRRIAEKAGVYLAPPAIGVTTEARADTKEGPGFLLLFFPGLIGLTLLYLAQVVALDFAVEHRQRTILRALATGSGTREHFVGKILGGMLLIAPLLLFVFGFGGALLRLPPARLLAGWALATAAGFAVLGALCLLSLIPRNLNQAGVITNIVILPVAFLGGCYFPVEALDDKLHAVASRLPMGWIVERIKDVVLGRPYAPSQPWIAAALCLAFGLILLAASGRFAARRFQGD